MTPPSEGTTLQLRRTIPAAREEVFRAWTDPDWLRQWFGDRDGATRRAELDVRVGGLYRIEMESGARIGYLTGRYLEVERPARLVYTFSWEGWPVEVPETQVTVEFHDRDGATEIVLTHERQPSPGVRRFHEWGWTHSLERLAGLLAPVHGRADGRAP